MNAIKFLIKEHNKVRTMFEDITQEAHREETKKKLFDELCQDLIRHEIMEETVWYPFLKKNDGLIEEMRHLIFEEKSAAKTIKEFEKITEQDDWEEKILTFKKDVEHHANDEETKLFPKVESVLNEEELEKIGKKMLEFKNEYPQ